MGCDFIQRVSASRDVCPTIVRPPGPSLVLPILIFVFCFWMPSSSRADDLIPTKGRSVREKGDVIVESFRMGFDPRWSSYEFWYLSNGQLMSGSVEVADYHVEFVPAKLTGIRDTWRQAGVTALVDYKDGRPPLELNNCFVTWKAPPGTYFAESINGVTGSARKERENGPPALSVTATGSSPFDKPDGTPFQSGLIPLFNISTIEFNADGSVKVALAGEPPFPAKVNNNSLRLLGGQGSGDLVPFLTGFTYEDGAYEERKEKNDFSPVNKPYFKEHSVAFSEVRKFTITNPVSRADTKPEILNLKVKSYVDDYDGTVELDVTFRAVGKISSIRDAWVALDDDDPQPARDNGPGFLSGDPIVRQEDFRFAATKVPYKKHSITISVTDSYSNESEMKTVWVPTKRTAPKTR